MADHIIVMVPRNIPICDMAKGIASVPAPMMVLTKFIQLLVHDACPTVPVRSRLPRGGVLGRLLDMSAFR